MQDTLDVWCCALEAQMKVSVNHTIQTAMYEWVDSGKEAFLEWIDKYPCQMLLVALDLRFSNVVNDIFQVTTIQMVKKKNPDKKVKFDKDGNVI